MASPKLYATFLLWLLSELFEQLPEIGDPDKPKLVFFFDEAHLLFDEAAPALIDTIERVVRLIRSKGVGVYFITQNPIDVPDKIAGQLGNRVQHALRAFTPRDQAAVRSAAETFRANPGVDVATAITELKVGEALVSLLQPDGSPSPVERTLIAPPRSRVGPATPEERKVLIETDAVGAKYDQAIDRDRPRNCSPPRPRKPPQPPPRRRRRPRPTSRRRNRRRRTRRPPRRPNAPASPNSVRRPTPLGQDGEQRGPLGQFLDRATGGQRDRQAGVRRRIAAAFE
ncbi:hypothetical protein GCM10020258_10040 [Sphingomonas yabuuchiae]